MSCWISLATGRYPLVNIFLRRCIGFRQLKIIKLSPIFDRSALGRERIFKSTSNLIHNCIHLRYSNNDNDDFGKLLNR